MGTTTMTNRTLVAIDPGDVYCGVAFFAEDPDVEHGWECVGAEEFDPLDFADQFAESIIDGDFDIVVIERFRLYADKARMQTGSEFETAQLIGILKWLIRAHNRHADAHAQVEKRGWLLTCEQPGGVCNDAGKPAPKHVKLILQMADIKKPTRAILNRKKIKSVAKPISKELYAGRDHVMDAELHGWKAILDKGVD